MSPDSGVVRLMDGVGMGCIMHVSFLDRQENRRIGEAIPVAAAPTSKSWRSVTRDKFCWKSLGR
jgi:hypothetical protein